MDSTDEGEESTVTSGRRLRARPSKVESDNDASESGRGRAKQKKRKAEVNIESLYLQENNREVCPTPLETIYETPQKQRKSGQRKGSASGRIREDEGETRQLAARGSDDLAPSSTVMGGKKIKRLCMFTSHYYPTKQKVRLRKDRARKMKQLKGVKIPKGSAVTVQDVKEVLAKLSDDESEQNENNQNTSNCSMLSMNSSVSFYVGNIIRPDTNDANFQDMIEDLQALQFNLPKETITEENSANEGAAQALATLYDLDEPIPFLDEIPNKKTTSQSREKKARRRSGKLTGCLLPSVSREATEESMSSGKSDLLPNPLASRLTETDLMSVSASETAISQIKETYVSDTLDNVKEETSTVRYGNKRRKTTKEKPPKSGKKTGLMKRASEMSDSELVKKLRGSKGDAKDDDEVGGSSESISFVDKGDELKFEVPDLSENVFSQNDIPSPTDFKPKLTRIRGGAKRQRGKRRASGIQRSLYHNQAAAALAHSESSSPESFLKDISSEDQETVNSESNEIMKISPTSPSTQMAALSLQCDLPFTSPTQDVETQVEQRKQRADRKARRRSSRLSIGGSSPSRSSNQIKSNLGSYWDMSSPCLLPNPPRPMSSGAPEGLHVTSESDLHLMEMPHSQLTTQTIDSDERGIQSDFAQLPINIQDPRISVLDSVLEEDISSAISQGDTNDTASTTTNFVSDAVFTTNLPVVKEDDLEEPVHADEDDNAGNIDSGNLNYTDHRTPKKMEECIWDMFRFKPKQKSKQRHTKVPSQNTQKQKKSPISSTSTEYPGSMKRENVESNPNETKSLQKDLERNDSVLKNPTIVLNHPTHESENQYSDDVSSTSAGSSEASQQQLPEQQGLDNLWDSPVISGMFEGKASIRLGKLFHNKESLASSPITTSQKYQPVLSTQPVSSFIPPADLPSLKKDQSEQLHLREIKRQQPQENLEGYR
ncbi:uncharacterized protein LOC122265012 [Penaeus japonicus]|uniref:uncharacterized protein LOC122265012 n=1 Tax=Penaeus japonicus TaxID=27405 RepID=UPI001C71115C|nr:uncharacterized protein LOC122265012 [Penaeus japonicus]